MKINFKILIKRILAHCGFRLIRLRKSPRSGLNINVGCGGYEIRGFESVDFYTEHYYRSREFKRIHYDMRNDWLPYDDDSVDTIYCSHVIEHIETNFVEKFFIESKRVLKFGGVLRIACPDSEFLYYQYCNHPEYFSWHPLYQSEESAELCFVDEVAGPKSSRPQYGLIRKLSEYSYEDLLSNLREDLQFDTNFPGRHINNWDFSRVSDYGTRAGFSLIEKSRHQGSFCPNLQGSDIDLTHPEMSLYVDLIKG